MAEKRFMKWVNLGRLCCAWDSNPWSQMNSLSYDGPRLTKNVIVTF